MGTTKKTTSQKTPGNRSRYGVRRRRPVAIFLTSSRRLAQL
jgi:hypothetical protein